MAFKYSNMPIGAFVIRILVWQFLFDFSALQRWHGKKDDISESLLLVGFVLFYAFFWVGWLLVGAVWCWGSYYGDRLLSSRDLIQLILMPRKKR